jgi:hypothetical protein
MIHYALMTVNHFARIAGRRPPMLTDADRKKLTEFLGECWHHITDHCVAGVWKHWWECDCGEKRFIDYIQALGHATNCTFTTEADMLAVYRKLVETGKWDEFCGEAHKCKYNPPYAWNDFFAWLFCLSTPSEIPDRMAMVAEFVKENV